MDGDKVIIVTKTFEDTSTYLKERTIKAGSPNGSTVLREGDRLVFLMAK